MNSKERVLRTLAHEPHDRVPINYSANTEIDLALKRHFNLADDDNEGLRQALGVDFRGLRPSYVGRPLHETPDGMRVDEWGVRRRWVEHTAGGYWDYCDWPLENAGLEEVEAWPMPSPDDYDYGCIKTDAVRFGDYCLVAGTGGLGDIINSTGRMRTMAQVLIDLATDDPAGLRLIDRKLEVHLEVTRRTLEAAAGAADLLWIGEDLGTQIGPILGLELFRKHLRPRLQQLVDLGKSFDLPVIIHSCGSSSWAFEDFIAMGINAVDTLQPEAAHMAPAELKERFGDRLAFHGMISTAGPLANGSPEDVVADVREVLDIMMDTNAYCLAPTHQIQSNSPVANVLAMYETGREYGRY